MPKFSDHFTSRWVSPNDLMPPGTRKTVRIRQITEEAIGFPKEKKLIAELQTLDGKWWKDLVISTKARKEPLEAVYGDDTDAIVDVLIDLWIEPYSSGGNTAYSIRLAVKESGNGRPVAGDDFADEIPGFDDAP